MIVNNLDVGSAVIGMRHNGSQLTEGGDLTEKSKLKAEIYE